MRGGLFHKRLIPPNMSTLVVWVDFNDLDGRNNSTLTVGQRITTGQVKNKGTLGGTFTVVGANGGPVLRQNASGLYELDFSDGGDHRLQLTFAAQAQPNIIAYVVLRNSSATTCTHIDGMSGARHAVLDAGSAGGMQVSAGTFIGASATKLTLGAYNLLYFSFNGASTNTDINNNFARNGAYRLTGNAGAQAPTGVNLGAANDGSTPLNGSLAGHYLMWHGSATTPSEQVVRDFFTNNIGDGYPTTTLHRVSQYGLLPTGNISIHGGDIILFTGDSITIGTPNIWMGPLETSINGSVSSACTFVNRGQAGQTLPEIQARFATNVSTDNPQACFVQGMTNDLIWLVVNDSTGSNYPDVVRTALQNIVATWTGSGRAANKLAFVGIFCRGEEFPSILDAQVRQYNTIMNRVAFDSGCAYVDVRTPLIAYEQANNTPPPGASTFTQTVDGVHPTTAPNGVTMMSNAALAKCVFSG